MMVQNELINTIINFRVSQPSEKELKRKAKINYEKVI